MVNLGLCCSLPQLLHVLWLLSSLPHYCGGKCSQQIEDQKELKARYEMIAQSELNKCHLIFSAEEAV